MMRKLLVGGFVALAAVLAVLPVVGATEDEIQAAIDAGIEWLIDQQELYGRWGDDFAVAYTSFAVLKLEDYAFENDYPSPFDPSYPYADNVLAGLNYIFENVQMTGTTVFFTDLWGEHESYITGIAMMALVAGRDPDRIVTTVGGSLVEGWTYKDVVQACVDFFVNTQNPDGGWRYFGISDSDNSNTGYAVLGLRYAELFGCAIPQSLKDNLDVYVDYIQCDATGGSGYDWPCDWVNVLKTGNLLFEMAFLEDDLSAARVQAALGYIEATWNNGDPNVGWKPNHYQAMYCLMKGFGSLGIRTITVGGVEVNWFGEFAQVIVDTQLADGSWPSDYWGSSLLSTEWALLVLEYVIPPLEVAIDIKPGSFPNSINPDQNGTTPVSILSNEGFDAPTLVDPESLTFGHTGDEDSLAYRGKKNPRPQVGYADVNGDGLVDVVAHFITELCGFVEGDVVGHLKGETFDGLDIFGSDSVRIVPPNTPAEEMVEPMEVAAGLSVNVAPSPIRDVHTAYFTIAGPMTAQVSELWVQVFDLSGRLVWEEVCADIEVAWHTNDLAGRYLANGIYVYQVLAMVGDEWFPITVDKIAILR
jgi:hypothetical protein